MRGVRAGREGGFWEKDDLRGGWERGDSWPNHHFLLVTEGGTATEGGVGRGGGAHEDGSKRHISWGSRAKKKKKNPRTTTVAPRHDMW